ncbi:unnamed protein product [Meganyctiphanes norvegica]|uniref:Death domain-containing protein n=1 Tax=Meganyctiphanes norvegica TaxID=48144 RepID=A0AAV2QXS3_MEGNR
MIFHLVLVHNQQLWLMRRCDRELSEEDKLSVSDHLGLKWCEVGRRMKLSDGQIENIAADHPRSIDRAYNLLTIWHDQESREATVAKLAAILLQCNASSALNHLSCG